MEVAVCAAAACAGPCGVATQTVRFTAFPSADSSSHHWHHSQLDLLFQQDTILTGSHQKHTYIPCKKSFSVVSYSMSLVSSSVGKENQNTSRFLIRCN